MAKTILALGIEVTGDETRIALIDAGERGPQVVALQTVRKGEDFARVLRAMPKRPSAAVCALPLETGGIRILNLPPTTDENLERVVLMEAEGVLPVGADELAMSYQPLGMTDQSRLEVLLVAAHQAAVDAALRQVNCVPWISARTTLAPMAALNAVEQLRGTARETFCAILKIERTDSELLILDKTRVIAAQSIPVGTDTPQILTSPQPLSPVPADSGAHPGLAAMAGPEGAWIATLSQQVRYALQAVAYERGSQIERLYVCGGGAAQAGADWRLSELLDFPVTLLSPKEGDPAGPTYAVAYGCALQAAGQSAVALNLTAARVTVAREVEQRRQIRISWGALAGAVVLAAALVYGALVFQTQRQLEVTEEKVRQLGPNLPKAEIAPEQLSGAMKAISDVSVTRVAASEALAMLSSELPDGAWLTELNYTADTGFVVRGYTLEQSGAQRAQIALLRKQIFDEVTLDSRTEEKLEGKQVWGFQISCKLRAPERKGGFRK